MKTINIGHKNTQKYTSVLTTDSPNEDGINHEYVVSSIEGQGEFALISFQNGPVQENGVNGCHHEDLLAIVIHRLRGFQSGPFSCRENAIALTKLEESMHWLKHRTEQREKRGVEGTSKK